MLDLRALLYDKDSMKRLDHVFHNLGMWTKIQSAMVVFLGVVVAIQAWRIATGPWFIKPHAIMDGVFALFLAIFTIEKEGKKLIPGVLFTSGLTVFAFVFGAWAFVTMQL